jgi:Cu+-exporting ATPase
MAVNGKLAGIMAMADPVRQSTREALRALAAEGAAPR